ncbi:MAG: hypothetical protein NC548_27385 [Lachnospiraceae bacterium]|nr:hypothetical protein [Lachnospiraceae bacterium]
MVSEKSKIYGVDNVGQSTPALTRTDSAIGLTVTVGASEIKSDFDRCYPWSDMHEVVDDNGNVFIRIPKFYSRITKNANGTYKHQLSGYRYEGFTTLFVDGKGNEIDYVLVGKYEASGSKSRAYSQSGKTCLVNITLPEMRTACRANGEGYQQYDFLIDAIIKELFLIEMATTNSQGVMCGYANGNSAAVQTGRTDSVKTASGSDTSNTDGKHACKYRGIENPWGNVWKWCDGITFDDTSVYICLDPTHYVSENTAAPYFYVGESEVDGSISKIEYFDKFPVLGYATEGNGDANTYYCDYCWCGGTVLYVGGGWSDGSDAGLWSWDGGYDAGSYISYIGGRLCYKPL